VVLPFTNIIRQSVEVYREALVLPGENPKDVVAELHHKADFENENTRHLTSLWRAPIIVTTAVAFFETLAARRPAALRRLHELPGSAIFVDEAHAALPAKLLPITWKWMNCYGNNWGCYWVLASGSLCRFWEINKISDGKPVSIPEITKDELRQRLATYENNRIVYKYDLTPKNATELANWVSQFCGPRLLILNTVQSAAVVAEQMNTCFGRKCVEHLSTALTAEDRDETLERVKKRLKNTNDNDWTLVATSCVEAGVDLSFRTGFREIGSLCSLLQAAGRVNREGKNLNAEMWSFCLADHFMLKTNPGMNDSARVLRRYFEKKKEIVPSLCTDAIKEELRLQGTTDPFQKLIAYESSQRFPCVEKNYRVITSDTCLAVVDSSIVEKIKLGAINWQEIQKHSVRIPKYKLEEAHIPKVLGEIYQWNLKYDTFLGYMAGIIMPKN
jgi:CRISPR/Cas system-associated endonuclease/helicase Cas3